MKVVHLLIVIYMRWIFQIPSLSIVLLIPAT